MNSTNHTYPRTVCRSLAAVVLAALLAGCPTMDMDSLLKHGGNLARSFSEDVTPVQRQAMGDEASALLLGAAPLVRHAAMQRYVNQLGAWNALQSDRNDITWRFGVLDTESVNAFAAPAGYIFITRGLFARLDRSEEHTSELQSLMRISYAVY